MKLRYTFIIALCMTISLTLLTGCSDFWDPETEDEFNGDDGFTSNTEMYTGFLGIMTKMQEIIYMSMLNIRMMISTN